MTEPLRVLQVSAGMNVGGIETLLMSIYRALDKDKIQFDFLETLTTPCFYDDEIREMGGRVYKVPSSLKKPITARNSLNTFFTEHTEYNIAHFHMGHLGNMLALKTAKRCGVQTRVLHAHNANVNLPLLRRAVHGFNSLRAPRLATDFFACSAAAAEYFGFARDSIADWKLIPNGIEIDKFAFDSKVRAAYRKKLGYGKDVLCVGMVGRYVAQKNHLFALDVFKQLHEAMPCTRLLIVGGEGALEEATVMRVHDLALDDSVTCLKDRADVNRLYSAMDAFLFPSVHEGLGIVLVEAQANGLPCIVSDAIPEEAIVCSSTRVVPLEASVTTWAEALKSALQQGRSVDGPAQVTKAGFNIDAVARELSGFYLSCNYQR